jgi:hypothetical protein
MILPQSCRGVAGCDAPRYDLARPGQESTPGAKAAPFLSQLAVALVALAAWAGPLQAGPLYLPNASFESPVVPPISPYAGPDIDYWQKSPQPAWYEPTNNYNTPWDFLTGTFYNIPFPGSFIDNCDGIQAAFLFALPEVALFQDYTSIYGTNTTPSHAFNAKFEVGKSYTLTVGVIGGGGGMKVGATLELSLYYRDGASNRVTVAATNITYTQARFPTNTHFLEFQARVPTVKAGDAWAGQNIGVQLLSSITDTNLAAGYWDLDNARLSAGPALLAPARTNGQFTFTLESEPGLHFEILATTNLSLPMSSWTNLGILTNVTGDTPFLDPATNLNRRFYRAHQVP